VLVCVVILEPCRWVGGVCLELEAKRSVKETGYRTWAVCLSWSDILSQRVAPAPPSSPRFSGTSHRALSTSACTCDKESVPRPSQGLWAMQQQQQQQQQQWDCSQAIAEPASCSIVHHTPRSAVAHTAPVLPAVQSCSTLAQLVIATHKAFPPVPPLPNSPEVSQALKEVGPALVGASCVLNGCCLLGLWPAHVGASCVLMDAAL